MNISGTITGLPAGVAKKKNGAKIPVNMFMQGILPPPNNTFHNDIPA